MHSLTQNRASQLYQTKHLIRAKTRCPDAQPEGLGIGRRRNRGLNPGRDQGIFLFAETSKPGMKPTHPPIQCYYSGGKAVRGKSDQSAPSSA